LDVQIKDIIRGRSSANIDGTKELEKAKKAINELFNKIKSIKEKAQSSETMVEDITRDIKKLDVAKKNLTTSITVLKRLQMLSKVVLMF
jgi:chromosome segregation ATPase